MKPGKKRRVASPYQRYGKAPYRYSQEYQSWRSALLRGIPREIEAASFAHRKRFGPAPVDAGRRYS